MTTLTDDQYQLLFTLRCAVRRFMLWSEREAAQVGLTPRQHQLLLTIRALPGPLPPSIGEVAESLVIRHHSAVELVSRVEAMGLLAKHPDPVDQRVVRLTLTPQGAAVLDRLGTTHLGELEHAASMLHVSQAFLDQLSRDFIEKIASDDA